MKLKPPRVIKGATDILFALDWSCSMYDDIAKARANPTPGQVINRPGGEDVYHGVLKDYTGRDVNAKTFLAVLSGDKDGVKGTHGSKKVISPAPEDNVFVYFADHGGNGILIENHVARAFADTEAIYSYEGTNEINSLIVGRHVTGRSCPRCRPAPSAQRLRLAYPCIGQGACLRSFRTARDGLPEPKRQNRVEEHRVQIQRDSGRRQFTHPP